MPSVEQSNTLLGARLLGAGVISEDQLDLALREQKRLRAYLGETLVGLGFVSQDILTSYLAQSTHAEVMGVAEWNPDPEAVRLVPYELAKRFALLPLNLNDGTLTVVIADTFNIVAIDTLERTTGLHVEAVTAPPQAIMEAIERHYAKAGNINDTVDQVLKGGVAALEEGAETEAPMIHLCNQIITLAIQNRATDIHIEPDEKIMRVRMRVDGILRQEVLMPKPLQSPVISRMKLMANLDVTEKRIPQDGRIAFHLKTREVDLRVSTLPTAFGESIVMRILDKSSVKLEFTSLGFSSRDKESVQSAMARPYGIILVTGPTGSGKTTTLYTALGSIDAQARSIFTLEDPIEYQLSWVRQTQVNADVGMTFPAGLRALLRQDPDVILVGEIRDKETADLAMRAALTGHLVFSTLHTNDAIGAIPRLIDLGVEPFMLPSSLVAIIGQRLVRRLCNECKVERENPEQVLKGLNVPIPEGTPRRLWRGEGCRACDGSGYRGRQGIYEVLSIDERFHDPIIHGPDMPKLMHLAREAGMQSMAEDGMQKALQGVTTIEEVMRVAGG